MIQELWRILLVHRLTRGLRSVRLIQDTKSEGVEWHPRWSRLNRNHRNYYVTTKISMECVRMDDENNEEGWSIESDL